MQLSCRRDYCISGFWSSCGFVPISERIGRATKEQTTLTTWIKSNPDYPSLFECCDDNSRARIVLDTNIVIDLCDKSCEETNAILHPLMDSYVVYYISKNVLTEIDSKCDANIRNSNREYAKSHFNVLNDIDEELYKRTLTELLDNKPSEPFSNTWFDISHIANFIELLLRVLDFDIQ